MTTLPKRLEEMMNEKAKKHALEKTGSERSFVVNHYKAGAQDLASLLLPQIERLENLLSLASDVIEQCADQGKIMPAEYDYFLEALVDWQLFLEGK